MRPDTFIYVTNRDGVPWQAAEFVCQHGYESQTCGVGIDNLCPQVGHQMIEWWNGLPKQWREREVVRSEIIGNGIVVLVKEDGTP